MCMSDAEREAAEPRSMEDYLARFQKNQKIDGFGIGNVHIGMPCPFCAAPGFLTYEILEVERVLARGATCKQCGRSSKALFSHKLGATLFEIVQTGGPDQPEWLTPKMRRLSP